MTFYFSENPQLIYLRWRWVKTEPKIYHQIYRYKHEVDWLWISFYQVRSHWLEGCLGSGLIRFSYLTEWLTPLWWHLTWITPHQRRPAGGGRRRETPHSTTRGPVRKNRGGKNDIITVSGFQSKSLIFMSVELLLLSLNINIYFYSKKVSPQV